MSYCPTCNGRFQEGTFCPKDGTQLLPDGEQPSSLVGQIIGGRYRLTKLLGQGGMGEVYAAEHIHITKRVAVKVLHPEISNNPEALARFKQEAQSASSIGHDNIVVIDDFGQMDDGRCYLSMEFLSGESLDAAMQAPGGMDPARALEVMIQVCDGLAAAHAKGIIHRDMKPENVFITKRSDGTEQVKILDFGIAKVSGTDNNDNLTKTGTVFGTPHYMSPEQALGQKLDHRADVYSVGVMLFEIFTGQVPFKAESFMGILSQHITKQPPSPSTVTPGRSIPQPIEDVILRAMAKEPDKRYGGIRELRQALQQILDGIRGTAGAGKPVAATMAFGSEVAAAGAGAAASRELQATVSDRPGPSRPPPGAVPTAPDMGIQATMASPVTAEGLAAAGAAEAPRPAALQTGPGPAASPTPIPKTMMADTGQQAVAGSVSPGPANTAVPVVPANYGAGAPAHKSHTGLIVGIVLGAVVLLGGGGAAAYFFYFAKGDSGGQGTAVAVNNTTGPAANSATEPANNTTEPANNTTEPANNTEPANSTTESANSTAEPANSTTEPASTTPESKVPAEKPATPVGVTPKPTPSPKPTPTPTPTPTPKPKPTPTPKPKPTPRPKPTPKPKPRKTQVQIKLVTVPGNARVRLNGRKTLGYTPVTLKLKPGQRMRLLLARGGYADKWVNITAGQEDTTKTFRLAKRAFGVPGADPGGVPGGDPFR